MTVPVAADGCSASPTGRQQRTLYVYMIRSTSSPGAVNVSATPLVHDDHGAVLGDETAQRAQDLDGPGHVVEASKTVTSW